MDSLAEGSPFVPVILLSDYVDRLLNQSHARLALIGFVFSFHSLLGNWTDVSLLLVFAFIGNVSSITAWVTQTQVTQPSIIALLVWASLSAISSFRQRDSLMKDDIPSQPYLVPCRTTHTRFFPKKHSFSYSYLIVGTPVGFQGRANGMISADIANGHKAWFDVDAADYLQRGHRGLGLRGKLDNFLKSQDVEPAVYPYAYLATAARFLGYHFNPVSFWYLYSSEKILSAIVLEVNNTFGERRPYLVTRDFEEEEKQLTDNQTVSDAVGSTTRAQVKNSWSKDFHVSPFNSRKGSYSLMARDPLGPNMENFRGIDVTINLASSKGHPKLVARLFSEGDAVDPFALGAVQKAAFVLQWFWVGFVTFPRIVKEAAALFFKRKLHVWYRPEPLKQSLGRLADGTERQLEQVFRLYLRHLVEHAPSPLAVKYIPGGITDLSEEVITSKAAISSADDAEHVELKVLTPVFYARFVHYAHDFEAIFSELAESCTLWADKPDLLPKIFLKKASPPLQAQSFIDFAAFKLIKRLRTRPELINRPLTSADTPKQTTHASDVRGFRISSMDAFVLGLEDKKIKAQYRSAVTQLFIADWVFGGSMELLTLCYFGARTLLAWTTIQILVI